MTLAKHITILSGGGSPQGDEYRPVYQLIEEESAKRGFSVDLVDYVGIGQFPDFGLGLNLPAAAAKALREIGLRPQPTGSTLLCRSFGCSVGAHLFASHAEAMRSFSRMILWGPSAYHTFWSLVARHPNSLGQFNQAARQKGVILHNNFWESMVPIEEAVKTIKGIVVEIAYGTKDRYCDAGFASYLGGIVRKNTACPVRVVEIPDAGHEIRPDPDPGTCLRVHNRIKADYFNLIFAGTQAS